MSSVSLPLQAETVVLGGGIVGCSVAYHLAQLGHRDVVLLEQNQLGAGTTWHAAGMVGRLRTSNSLTEINRYSAELYAQLEELTGHSVGWKEVGSLIVAQSDDRLIQLRRTVAMARYYGIEAEIISASEAKSKWPLIAADDLKGAAWLPHDGKVIPGEVPKALALGASNQGVKVLEGVRVLGLAIEKGRVCGVRTTQGDLACERVVLAGGMWTRQFGLAHGINLPLWPVEHHYVVTEPIEGCYDELPLGRDPDGTIYFRGEGNGIMLGAFQKDSKPWEIESVPDDFSFQLFEADWDRYQAPLAAARKRLPIFESVEFEKFVNGPESFTPDNHFLLGETAEVAGVFVAAGFNSVGIASAGGAGKCLAAWIVDGKAPMDLSSVDVRRFGGWANQEPFLKSRVREVLGLHYQMAWPNLEFETGRGQRLSPVHDRLVAHRASFGVKAGWERPNWFAREEQATDVVYSFGRQNWFENHAREHRAAREAVALFDQSAFGKLSVSGPDSLALLERVCANRVDVPVGRIVYSGMLNHQGGYESDLTVVRVDEDQFYLVTGTAQAVRDKAWMSGAMRDGEQVQIQDVSADFAVLSVMGPQARAWLQALTDVDFADEVFPFGAARVVEFQGVSARALRVTYVGELGWELHVAASDAAGLFDRLTASQGERQITLAGYYAIQSLRLEKGYRAWGADISPDDNPMQAGLSFAVDLTKDDFVGRDAVLAQKENPLNRRLLQFTVNDPDVILWGNEPILRDDQVVGYTSSAAYGHTVGASVALGYVKRGSGAERASWLEGTYEVENNGQRYSLTPHLRPVYDPGRSKLL